MSTLVHVLTDNQASHELEKEVAEWLAQRGALTLFLDATADEPAVYSLTRDHTWLAEKVTALLDEKVPV